MTKTLTNDGAIDAEKIAEQWHIPREEVYRWQRFVK